jgi:hypothetical protein
MNYAEIKGVLPQIEIPEDQEIDDKGWNKMDHIETLDDLYDRCKEFGKQIKEMAKSPEH